jgi:hypothetical protein
MSVSRTFIGIEPASSPLFGPRTKAILSSLPQKLLKAVYTRYGHKVAMNQ